MAIAKTKCDICERDVNPEELIACDECYHKVEKEHQDFEELCRKISLLLDKNLMDRLPLETYPFPRQPITEVDDENPSD